jgi:hypothetical protein
MIVVHVLPLGCRSMSLRKGKGSVTGGGIVSFTRYLRLSFGRGRNERWEGREIYSSAPT